MVTASTQKKQRQAEAKAKAAANAKVDQEIHKAKARAGANGRKNGEYPFTADDIINERDSKGLSWRQVAVNLDLPSPGAARKAYSVLTGKSHNDSQPILNRARKGSGTREGRKLFSPNWNDDSDQDEIIERVQGQWFEPVGDPGNKTYVPGHYRGSTIVVVHDYKGLNYEEEVRVRRIDKFAFDGKENDGPLVMHVLTDHGFRVFRVQDIKEVR